MWDFWNSRTVTARKTYRCDESGCVISPGDRHDYTSAKYDGDFMTFRICSACSALRGAIWAQFDLDDDEGPPLGHAREWLNTEHGIADADAWLEPTRAALAETRRAEAARRAAAETTKGVVGEIHGERARQVNEEGWTAAHDDAHDKGELARGAAAYALHGAGRSFTAYGAWPWRPEGLKSAGQRRDLIKAAALIVAEIERLDRIAAPPARAR